MSYKGTHSRTSFSLSKKAQSLLRIIAGDLGLSKTATLELAIRDKAREVSAKARRLVERDA